MSYTAIPHPLTATDSTPVPGWRVQQLVSAAERDGFIGNDLVRELLTELEADHCDPPRIHTLVHELRNIPALAR